MKKCYNIKTWEDITDRITIGAKGDCIFIVHYDGSIEDFFTDSGDCVEKKLSTFEMLERMIDHDDACRNLAIKQSTPTDPVLAKFCELTGAKIFGDYAVLDFLEIKTSESQEARSCPSLQGDVFNQELFGKKYKYIFCNKEIYYTDTSHIKGFYYHCIDSELKRDIGHILNDLTHACIDLETSTKEKTTWVRYLRSHRCIDFNFNVFEEYSKHLRNEENKFEEIKKLLNL